MREFLSSALLVAIAPASAVLPATTVATAQHPQPEKAMPDERFWSIIDATVPFADDGDRQLESLRLRLEALPVEDVAAFQAQFDRKKAEAYTWDLWGAAFVIHGGASDDGFDYFRCWLISRGRAFYEAALAKPDSLASLIPAGPNDRSNSKTWPMSASKSGNAGPALVQRISPRVPFSRTHRAVCRSRRTKAPCRAAIQSYGRASGISRWAEPCGSRSRHLERRGRCDIVGSHTMGESS